MMSIEESARNLLEPLKSLRNISFDFASLLENFEKKRNFQVSHESEGIASERGEQYKFPDNNEAQLKKITDDREKMKGLDIKPDMDYEIPGKKGKVYEWKPHKVELYGISRQELSNIKDDILSSKRLLRVVSLHGAAHSVAMLIMLIRNKINFDFAYYTHLPNEMIDEKEFILYYVREKCNHPLVIVHPQNSAIEYYRNIALLPKPEERWCTREMKLFPWRAFLKNTFYNFIETGDHVDMVQFLGVQAYQSSGRAEMSPRASPSQLSFPRIYGDEMDIDGDKVYLDKNGFVLEKQLDEKGNVIFIDKSGKILSKWSKHKSTTISWPTYINGNLSFEFPIRALPRLSNGNVDWTKIKAASIEEWHEIDPNARIMRIFDMLPVFYLKLEDDLRLERKAGIWQNPNEREFGRHGCLTCPFASAMYYHQLRTTPRYLHLYQEAVRRRDAASEHAIKKGDLEKPWTQYGDKSFPKYMADYGYTDEDGNFHYYSRDDPPF